MRTDSQGAHQMKSVARRSVSTTVAAAWG
jgi:hypothetical protein